MGLHGVHIYDTSLNFFFNPRKTINLAFLVGRKANLICLLLFRKNVRHDERLFFVTPVRARAFVLKFTKSPGGLAKLQMAGAPATELLIQ